MLWVSDDAEDSIVPDAPADEPDSLRPSSSSPPYDGGRQPSEAERELAMALLKETMTRIWSAYEELGLP